MKRRKFCVIGPGKLGTALARLLDDAGWEFCGAAGRSLSRAENVCAFIGKGTAVSDPGQLLPLSEIVLITTPDDSIEPVCTGLAAAGLFQEKHHVIHCSGVYSSEILDSAADSGAKTGSLHPLQSFASFEEAVKLLQGSYCSIEGHEQTRKILGEMAQSLGLKTIEVEADKKILYHAGAVAASNFLVALEDIACSLEEAAGIRKELALKALMPLIYGTVKNMENSGMPDALTGPFARGDAGTVKKHIEQIQQCCPEVLDAYSALGRRALRMGIQQGNIDENTAGILENLLLNT